MGVVLHWVDDTWSSHGKYFIILELIVTVQGRALESLFEMQSKIWTPIKGRKHFFSWFSSLTYNLP